MAFNQATADVFLVRVMWGSVDFAGNWFPNQFLEMTPEEQYRQNVANGTQPFAVHDPYGSAEIVQAKYARADVTKAGIWPIDKK